MNDIQTILARAQQLHHERHYESALEQYSHAFDMLIDTAGVYAMTELKVTDLQDREAHRAQLVAYSQLYLRRDLLAATLLYQMGVLFSELGEYENAEQKLQEAIDYTPLGEVYDEPHTHLQAIRTQVEEASARDLGNA